MMIQALLFAFQIKDKYAEDEVSVYAAQTSFFIVLSAFPFIMVLLTAIQMIPSVSKADLLSLLVSLMPQMLKAAVVRVVDDLFTKSPGKILSITALAALWSASKGMLSMCRGLNRIYGCQEKRGYLLSRLICTVYTFIFMVACVMSLVLLVFGSDTARLNHPDADFYRVLYPDSRPEAEGPLPASGGCVFHALLDCVLVCIFHLL